MLSRFVRRFKKRFGARTSVRLLEREFPQYDIGAHSYGGLIIRKYDEKTMLRVGKYCSFAANVQVMLGGEHRPDWVTTYPFSALDRRHAHIEGHPASRGDIIIGNDVWFGRETIIMSGVTVGDGAVVAARSLVTRDVAPYAIVGGQPAKTIRIRFDDDTVAKLLAICWWDWPDRRVFGAVPLLMQPNIARFISAVQNGEI